LKIRESDRRADKEKNINANNNRIVQKVPVADGRCPLCLFKELTLHNTSDSELKISLVSGQKRLKRQYDDLTIKILNLHVTSNN
jgi:hypothetical protein